MSSAITSVERATSPPELLRHLDRPRVAGPGWLEERRQSAMRSLRQSGFPTRKTEGWRFVSLKALLASELGRADTSESVDIEALGGSVGDWQPAGIRGATFNGRPVEVPRAGANTANETPVVSRFGALDPASDRGWVERCLATVAPREAPFGAFNTALFEDVLLVRIPASLPPRSVIHLVHGVGATSGPAVSAPRTLIYAEPGSDAIVVESYRVVSGDPVFTSAVTEIVVAAAARLEHVRDLVAREQDHHIANLAVRQHRDSHFASSAVTVGGALSRLDLSVELAEPGAECRLGGLYHASASEHVGYQVFVDHAAPHGTSHQLYRGVLDGRGKAEFDGIVAVRPDAQRTSAHQANHNLLLSDDAVVHTKPHLEIEADDVSCSHGATVGALDEASMFYLRARGIGADHAAAMLTHGFVRTVLGAITDPPTRRRLEREVMARLPHGSLADTESLDPHLDDGDVDVDGEAMT
jgi:Fe-S cluster assembly protein SufD